MFVQIFIRNIPGEPLILENEAAQTFVDKLIKEKGTFITVAGGNQSAVFRREEISVVIVNEGDK